MIQHTDTTLRPDCSRVLVRPYIPLEQDRVEHIISRALTLTECETEEQIAFLTAGFGNRHPDIRVIWQRHFEKVKHHVTHKRELSEVRKLYIGALFSGEYALESAALFNPSIVPHPDQSGLEEGDLRCVISLRAIGEEHISSIEFRSAIIHRDASISIDVPAKFVSTPELNPDSLFFKTTFVHKLKEMGFDNPWATQVLTPLKETFTRQELQRAMELASKGRRPRSREIERTVECVLWLAASNYEIHFDPAISLSERIIFPVSANEIHGMEDARFVRFVDDDGSVTYYATYTAYNGTVVLPQLLMTKDFLNFRISTLNGSAIHNKGMAIFPRRIKGRYAILSRHDEENLFLMYSDDPHFWSDPVLLQAPLMPWETVKIGNCGSPIETPSGWLVLTHGVGAMRRYCIGAMLLDLDDPSKVLGHFSEPLISPDDNEREGYVPNVVYTCGALIHNGRLILPYGVSDTATKIMTFELEPLLTALLTSSPSAETRALAHERKAAVI